MRVRRAAIQTTLRQLGSCTTEDSLVVSNVIRGVALQNARSPRRVPMWDLRLVLDFLQSSQFEPLHKADMLHLTQKTVFLVALACGRRSSEIHAISGRSSDVAFTRQNSAILRFLPEFLAKNQKTHMPSPSLEILPLSALASTEDAPVPQSAARSVRFPIYRGARGSSRSSVSGP